MTRMNGEERLDLPDILNDMAAYFSGSSTSIPTIPEVRRASTLANEQLKTLDPAYKGTPYMSDEVSFRRQRS